MSNRKSLNSLRHSGQRNVFREAMGRSNVVFDARPWSGGRAYSEHPKVSAKHLESVKELIDALNSWRQKT